MLEINERRLEELQGTGRLYVTKYDSLETKKIMGKSLPIEDQVRLKVGAPVIVMVNEPAAGYHNGTQGRITDMSADKVVIKTVDGDQLNIAPHQWKIDLGPEKDGGKKLFRLGRRYGSAWGMPLKLGWAATIHKSQGLTLERVRTDVSQCWEPGHAYVALSRAVSMLGVSLVRPFKKVLADPEALSFTRSLQ